MAPLILIKLADLFKGTQADRILIAKMNLVLRVNRNISSIVNIRKTATETAGLYAKTQVLA